MTGVQTCALPIYGKSIYNILDQLFETFGFNAKYINDLSSLESKYFGDTGNHLLQIFLTPTLLDKSTYASEDFGKTFIPKFKRYSQDLNEWVNPIFLSQDKFSDILKLYRNNPYNCIVNDTALLYMFNGTNDAERNENIQKLLNEKQSSNIKPEWFSDDSHFYRYQYLLNLPFSSTRGKPITLERIRIEGCHQILNWLQARLWTSKLILFDDETQFKIFEYTSDKDVDWISYKNEIREICKKIIHEWLSDWKNKIIYLKEKQLRSPYKRIPDNLKKLLISLHPEIKSTFNPKEIYLEQLKESLKKCESPNYRTTKLDKITTCELFYNLAKTSGGIEGIKNLLKKEDLDIITSFTKELYPNIKDEELTQEQILTKLLEILDK